MNTCKKCKHCLVIDNGGLSPARQMLCTLAIEEIDYVTGYIRYRSCLFERKNKEHCDRWEQRGIKGFFQRLFKKFNSKSDEKK